MSEVGLSGHLRLVCAVRGDGSTYLAEQSFAAPIHLSKSYWDGETLLIHVVNPTAGIFGGDRIVTQVEVKAGACVLLSSPSAARFHPSQERESRLEQTFVVRAGGRLDVLPEISIPQRGSRSFLKTVIDLEAGAELIYLETLTPGRVASGEIFAFDRFVWHTDITVAGRTVLRERAAISPPNESLGGLTALFPAGYHAGITVISPVTEGWAADFGREVAALGDDATMKLAASRLNAHGWLVRILTRDGVGLQEAIRKIRALIYHRLDRPQPNARRNSL